MSPSAALTDVLVKSQQTSKSHCEVYTQLRKRQFQYFYPPVDEHRVVPYSMCASIWCSTSPSCSSFHVQYFLSCKFSFFFYPLQGLTLTVGLYFKEVMVSTSVVLRSITPRVTIQNIPVRPAFKYTLFN